MTTPFHYSIACLDEPKRIVVNVSGQADTSNIIDLYTDIVRNSTEHDTNKVLLDSRELVLNYPMTEFLPLMKQLKPLLSELVLARLCTEGDLKQALVEDFGKQHDLQLKNFDCRESAVEWLQTTR